MSRRPLSRRALLGTVGTIGTVGVAGCSSDNAEPTQPGGAEGTPESERSEETDTTTVTNSATGTSESDDTATPESGEDNRVYVDTEGSDDNPGTADDPLATIRTAVERAGPGETVYVNSGEYQESFLVREGGTPDAPLEITGPVDAVLRRPADAKALMTVGGNHVHVTGLSITGLSDPSRPEDVEAYADAPLVLFTAKPPFDSLNQGAVFAPHQVGHSGAQLVKFRFCRDAEAGPFRVTGRAGAAWQLSEGGHPSGEIVYVGTSPSTLEKTDAVNRWDDTRNVRVHHVDNSAGHPHNQLVDIKPGTENVTVEYCTDGGGSYNNKDWSARSIAVRGHAATVRWNRLQDGEDDGIGLGSGHNNTPENELQERAGEDNEIYGNEIFGFGGKSIRFPYISDGPGQAPEDQATICGNTVEPPADGAPGVGCSGDVPTTDQIGHVGGDGPWPDETLPAVPSPEFTVRPTLERETVAVDDQVVVTVAIGNTGRASGTKSLELTANGSVVATDSVRIPAGETVETELRSGPAPEPGTFDIELNGEPVGEVTVESEAY